MAASFRPRHGAEHLQWGAPMIDPSSRVGRELKTAEDFFELAKNASSPFLQAYYRRVAERYLSSQGELKSVKAQPGMAKIPYRPFGESGSIRDRQRLGRMNLSQCVN